MMSLETIQELSREAAEKAAELELEPFIVWEEDLETFPPFPFPNLGSHVPEHWELVETYFVDSSGFGSESEPALTIEQFKRELVVGRAYGIIASGQFQVEIGEFIRANDKQRSSTSDHS